VDDFARLSSQERQLYFEQAAAQRGLLAQFVEKDFWVCWSLKRLFLLDDFRDHLTFKGGTSLSKIYHVIERFSEDVDVAIERSFLGFGGNMEPEKGESGKEQQHRIERLKEACRIAISQRLEPQLRNAISTQIGNDAIWTLTPDSASQDGQTLLFQYPPAITSGLSPNFTQSVKIELGARSDHFPVESASMTPYLCDAFPNALPDRTVEVRVLGAERTFWEKATILHMLHHYPDDKQLRPHMARHYYDVFQMSNSPVWERSIKAIDILDRVAAHNNIFFKTGWANYDKARRGTLRLTPCEQIVASLKKDYETMQPMFFGEVPPFEKILSRLPELENLINK
jgi:hypothetical protein